MAKRSTSTNLGLSEPLDGPVADTLDLHGHTRAEGCARVKMYLRDARRRFPGQLVHIITGKGRNSLGQPVLLPAIRKLLHAAPPSQVAVWGLDEDGEPTAFA
jgi:DNA-nicking Smr family endonuclease